MRWPFGLDVRVEDANALEHLGHIYSKGCLPEKFDRDVDQWSQNHVRNNGWYNQHRHMDRDLEVLFSNVLDTAVDHLRSGGCAEVRVYCGNMSLRWIAIARVIFAASSLKYREAIH
jgi:hypothetical protein